MNPNALTKCIYRWPLWMFLLCTITPAIVVYIINILTESWSRCSNVQRSHIENSRNEARPVYEAQWHTDQRTSLQFCWALTHDHVWLATKTPPSAAWCTLVSCHEKILTWQWVAWSGSKFRCSSTKLPTADDFSFFFVLQVHFCSQTNVQNSELLWSRYR